jgi:hypothetical protein
VTKLDYEARPERSKLSRAWIPALFAVLCFGGSWFAWLMIGIETYDPFDDVFVSWVGFMVLVPGTLCGASLWACVMVALAIARLFSRRFSR